MKITVLELRRLVREAYSQLDPELVVFLRMSRRPDLGHMVTVGHTFTMDDSLAASMRLRKFQDLHGEVFMPTAEERKAMPSALHGQGMRSAVWTFQLGARSKKEADFQFDLVVADLEGKGFTVEVLPDEEDTSSGSPYR